MRRLGSRQQQIVRTRLRIIRAWEHACEAARGRGVTRRQLAGSFVRQWRRRGVRISFRTIQLWQSEYRAAGLLGLVDRRWLAGLAARHRRQLNIAPFLAELARRYTGPGLLSFGLCYALATEWAAEHAAPVATRREARRYLKLYVLPRLTTEPDLARRPRKGRSTDI
jgi:hypothetical protein